MKNVLQFGARNCILSLMIDQLENVKLTTKQRLFIDYYMTTFNATESAKKAGYQGKFVSRIGSNLLRTPKIKDVIDSKLGKVRLLDADITPQWVKDTTRQTINDCKNPKDKFFGLDLLARMLGMFDVSKSGDTFNLFAILNSQKPAVQGIGSTGDRTSTGILARKISDVVNNNCLVVPGADLPTHPPVQAQGNIDYIKEGREDVNSETDSTHATSTVDGVSAGVGRRDHEYSHPEGQAGHPPDTLNDNNSHTQKIVDKNPKVEHLFGDREDVS